MMRSHLKCLSCEKDTKSYEPFTTLQLPIPESKIVYLTVHYFSMNHEIKNLLLQALNPKREFEEMKEEGENIR